MSTKLEFHLYPRGRSANEPDLMPSVLDSDGNAVLFTSVKRKTTEATVVNLGDSPNSNNGDPLRTAFTKINNFIEASYWTNEGINQKFKELDSDIGVGVGIYSDSDERYGISMGGDSKFYIRGTANQIETSFSRQRSVNNDRAWDSEVNLKFQLAHDLETYNVTVNKLFTIKDSDNNNRITYRYQQYPTTYNERAQNGLDAVLDVGSNVVLGRDSDDVVIVKGRVASNLVPYGDEIYSLGDSDNKWKDLYLSGSTIYLGSIQIKNSSGRGLTLLDSDGNTLDIRVNSGDFTNLTVDSDMLVSGLARVLGNLSVANRAFFDSDLTVGGETTLNGPLVTNGDTTFNSNVVITGSVTAGNFVSSNTTNQFDDPVRFTRRVTFDSDVVVGGTLTIVGGQSVLSTQSLAVSDNLIILNSSQSIPVNDTGLIFTRYDSDNVSAANWNGTLLWDEGVDQFTFGETDSAGTNGLPNITQKYMSVGKQTELYDSENTVRVQWDKTHATLKIMNEVGNVVFQYNSDTGEMTGDGFINGGTF